MTEPDNGKLIIRAIPDETTAERVVAFLCANARNATPEKMAARLRTLPLVLAKSIRADSGKRIAAALMDLGADAVFIPDSPPAVAPEPAEPTLIQIHHPPSSTSEPPNIPSPGSTNRSLRQPLSRLQKVPGVAEADRLHRIAAAQKLLIWGVLAVMVPFISPVLYAAAIPFQLYAVYRTSKALDFGGVAVVVYLIGMLIPLISLGILLILNSKATKALKNAGVGVGLIGARSKDLKAVGGTPQGSLLGPIFTLALLVIGIGGVSTGNLPSVMPGHEDIENIEKRLEREAQAASGDLPKNIDADTRIDRIAAGPGKKLTLSYTLIKYRASEMDEGKFREVMAEKLKSQACGSSELRPFIREGVSIDYSYNGNDGNPLTIITVTQTDCGT